MAKYILKNRFSDSYICRGTNEDRYDYFDITKDVTRAIVFKTKAEASLVKKQLTYDHINSRVFDIVATLVD